MLMPLKKGLMNFKYFKYDFMSSLVVFLVALPLCLGIALASGAPMASGLVAGMIGGLVVGFLSDSPISVSGPAAGLTTIVSAAILELGSFGTFSLAVVFAGVLQIIFSFLRGGTLGNFFPSSVIKGMLAAIGIILILKQFPHAIGYDVDFMGDEAFMQADGENTFSELLIAFNRYHVGSLVVGALSMLIMLAWEAIGKKNKKLQLVPGALIAVTFGIVLNSIFTSSFPQLAIMKEHLVNLPFKGGVSDFISVLTFPDWSRLSEPLVYKSAIVLALVASIESLLSVEAADKLDQDGRVASKNKELFAQGVGNSISGLIGGLPVTAVIVRTSANASAGARTNLSAVLHGAWLILCVLLIPNVLNLIPLSTLAAMLILVGYKLTKPALIKDMYQRGWNQFIPFAVTILAILFTDLLIGISIGMVVGFIFVIRSNIKKSIVMVNEGNQYLIRFHKDVSFLQKNILINMLSGIPDKASVVIDGSRNVFVDNDIEDLIQDFMKRANGNGTSIELKKSTLALSPLFKE